MIEYKTTILQFGEQGEKTGWRYIEIPADLAQKLKPGNKKAFRVRGMLDSFPIQGFALLPMGEGRFIMPIKAEIRKSIRKEVGAMLTVKLEEHKDFKVAVPADLQECFEFDPEALTQFEGLAMSHRNYFIKWIESAKTDETRAKRIVNTINAMLRKWSYNVMIREMRNED
ncbi:YdeI/OmpD-associated family protein [Mucilaginibacter sp. UR6-11]|uniref:YdeI/OmpD-associated family protein n=1 Tax=Mucilaginibacter sp. UR6-11 TaxID=1435644 RepID=UPI001E351403|nr:YdeI/OmpD-associated family protein [Mucilaginibacter sp. UR6-11]MCC8424253.1 YdeI/OmpD-associated family protein [Mucilaginibacter sp. UR6-11]